MNTGDTTWQHPHVTSSSRAASVSISPVPIAKSVATSGAECLSVCDSVASSSENGIEAAAAAVTAATEESGKAVIATTSTSTGEAAAAALYAPYYDPYWSLYGSAYPNTTDATISTYNNSTVMATAATAAAVEVAAAPLPTEPFSNGIPPPPGEECPQPPLPSSEMPPLPPPPPPPAEGDLAVMVQPPPPPPPSVSPDDEMMEICYLEKNVEENSVAPGGEQFCVSAEPKLFTAIAGPVDYTSKPVLFPAAAAASSSSYQAGYSALYTSAAAAQMNTCDITASTSQNSAFTVPGAHKEKIKKVKKMKKPAKKPPKEVSGMMVQWQKAKESRVAEEDRLIRATEQELEELNDPNKRIEKWKKSQIETGKASNNANFQPVGDGWKERVKKKRR